MGLESLFHDVHPGDFVTIGLLVMLEGLLSADNAMVLAVLVLGLRARLHRDLAEGGDEGGGALADRHERRAEPERAHAISVTVQGTATTTTRLAFGALYFWAALNASSRRT